MKITDAKVFVCCPGRNFVTLKITTDEGIYGVGDGTLNGREKAVVSYLEDYLIPALIGRDPHQIEDIWQFFYRGAYWRRGPVTMTAIAAVDTALTETRAAYQAGVLRFVAFTVLLVGFSAVLAIDRRTVYRKLQGEGDGDAVHSPGGGRASK